MEPMPCNVEKDSLWNQIKEPRTR